MSQNQPSKDVIIIGAGIAGLAAGCFAQQNGYRSQVFELHSLPGGLCTAWHRKGYVFDGCLHYLFGTGQGQPFSDLWNELGIANQRRYIHHTEMMRITDPEGKNLIVYSDPDRLEAHMKELSPADSRLIEAFCGGIRRFTRFDMSIMQQKPKELMSLADWARLGGKMVPYLDSLMRWAFVSAGEFGRRFKDPFLRRAVPQMFAWEDIPVMVGMSLLAYMHIGNAGVPEGASLEFARDLEKRYLELGGEIQYGCQVEHILVEEDQAAGVRLYDNSEHRAEWVVAACDMRGLIFDLLGGKYASAAQRRLFDGHLPIHSQLQVSLGVNRDMSDEPHWVTYLLEKPVHVAGQERYEIGVKNYCYDRSLAPEGKSAVEVMMVTDYDYWQRIYGRTVYDKEQIQESGILIDWLDTVYPGIKADIEFNDVATPLSYERYTGNWQGSSCGWLLTRQTMPMMILGMRKTLPGLKNLIMAGQWVEPGGSVPVVAMSGKNAVQQMCAADGKRFISRR